MNFNRRDGYRSEVLEWVLNHPASCLAVTGLLTLGMSLGVTKLELRTDGEALYPSGNATISDTLADRIGFVERSQVVVLMTSRPDGPRIDSRVGLQQLRALHRELASLPFVDRLGPRSLANLLDPNPDVHPLLIEEFLREIPSGPELDARVRRMHAFALSEGLYLAPNGRAAAIYLPISDGADRREVVAALQGWLASALLPADSPDSPDPRGDSRDRAATPAFDLRLVGPAVAEATLGDKVLLDLLWLVPIMVVVVSLLLFFFLGTLGGVLIPMAGVLMVLLWTLGAMGLCGVPITLVTTVLPVILMTMAVTDEIHLLERYQALRGAGQTGRSSAREALRASFAAVGRPIVLTSLTSAAAFLSFLTASIEPIRTFGLFSALGILFAMLLTFSFIPALIVVVPQSWFEARWRRETSQPETRETRLLPHERLAVRHPAVAAIVGVLAVVALAPGTLALQAQDAWVDNFDPESDLVRAAADFDANFWGGYRFDIVLSADQNDFFESRAGFHLMETLRRSALAAPHVGGVLSYLLPYEVVAEIEGYPLPLSALEPGAIARVRDLVKFIAHRVDLARVLKRHEPEARLRLFVQGADHRKGLAIRDYLDGALPGLLTESGVRYHFSGDLPAAVEVVAAVVSDQLRSLAWAIVAAGLLVLLATRSVISTAAILAPVVTALPLVFGAMGYAGIPLGIATSMFAALTIGVGVDFGLHLDHAYHRARQAGAAREESRRLMFASAGRAVRWNATTLAIGFLALSLSAMKPNHSLGLLLSAAMLSCYAMSVLLLPWLLRSSQSTGTAASSSRRDLDASQK